MMLLTWAQEITAVCALLLTVLVTATRGNDGLELDPFQRTASLENDLYNRENIRKDAYKSHDQPIDNNLIHSVFGLNNQHNFVSNKELSRKELLKNDPPSSHYLLRVIDQITGPSCEVQSKLFHSYLFKKLQQFNHISGVDSDQILTSPDAKQLCQFWNYLKRQLKDSRMLSLLLGNEKDKLNPSQFAGISRIRRDSRFFSVPLLFRRWLNYFFNLYPENRLHIIISVSSALFISLNKLLIGLRCPPSLPAPLSNAGSTCCGSEGRAEATGLMRSSILLNPSDLEWFRDPSELKDHTGIKDPVGAPGKAGDDAPSGPSGKPSDDALSRLPGKSGDGRPSEPPGNRMMMHLQNLSRKQGDDAPSGSPGKPGDGRPPGSSEEG